MRLVKKILLLLLVIFIIIQFIRPSRNISATSEQQIRASLALPVNVENILRKSCYDCHSNNTQYPWYANIQPMAWFLADHVKEGKKELNFNNLSSLTGRRQRTKYRGIEEMIEENEMPLSSYTLMHSDAKLTAHEKETLINWAEKMQDIADKR